MLAWWEVEAGQCLCPSDALVCARCGERTGFNGWRWPVPCAFAELGLRFWNWPPLADAFVADLAAWLGHRLVAGSCGI